MAKVIRVLVAGWSLTHKRTLKVGEVIEVSEFDWASFVNTGRAESVDPPDAPFDWNQWEIDTGLRNK